MVSLGYDQQRVDDCCFLWGFLVLCAECALFLYLIYSHQSFSLISTPPPPPPPPTITTSDYYHHPLLPPPTTTTSYHHHQSPPATATTATTTTTTAYYQPLPPPTTITIHHHHQRPRPQCFPPVLAKSSLPTLHTRCHPPSCPGRLVPGKTPQFYHYPLPKPSLGIP